MGRDFKVIELGTNPEDRRYYLHSRLAAPDVFHSLKSDFPDFDYPFLGLDYDDEIDVSIVAQINGPRENLTNGTMNLFGKNNTNEQVRVFDAWIKGNGMVGPTPSGQVKLPEGLMYIVNLAAETHIDDADNPENHFDRLFDRLREMNYGMEYVGCIDLRVDPEILSPLETTGELDTSKPIR